MRRIAAIALITSLATTAYAKPRPPSCEKTSQRFSARQAEWETFSSKSFTDALAREQLTTPAMTEKSLATTSPLLEGARSGASYTMPDGSLAFYAGNVQGYHSLGKEFVQDAQGVIHPLVRKENVIGSESHLLCGCGPMGGGAVPPTFAIIYVLPAGTTFDPKPIELAYDAKHIAVRYNFMNGTQMCQPPP